MCDWYKNIYDLIPFNWNKSDHFNYGNKLTDYGEIILDI